MKEAYFPMIFDFSTGSPAPSEHVEPQALNFLTAEDWQLISQKARFTSYGPDAIILEKGETRRAIFIIEKGTVRIEKAPGDIIARRGQGTVFGEMSFLESVGASAWVVADGPIDASVVEEEDMNYLLENEPDLAARFYQTLAVTLAWRLRQASELLAG